MEVKKPYLSKTLWINFIMAAVALFVPGVSEWMSGHMDMVAMVFTGVNMLLRLVTKDKIGLSD